MISIFDLETAVNDYGIVKWNDYIHVQKMVKKHLNEMNFWDKKSIVNKATGIMIFINKKGVEETFSKGKRFANMPKELKKMKVATIGYIKEIIANAVPINLEVDNYHAESGRKYMYFESEILMENKQYTVRVTVQKRIDKNMFWIHYVDVKQQKRF